MKKLITLFLAIAGCVGTMSATDYYVIGSHSFIGEWNLENGVLLTQGLDGIYRVTCEDISISSETTIEYKVTEGKSWDVQWGNSSGNNQTYTLHKGVYNITFMFDPNDTFDDGCHVYCEAARTDDIYFVSSTDDFKTYTFGNKLTQVDGVYTGSIDATQGMVFALIPASCYSGGTITDWDNMIWPSGSSWYDLYVNHLAGTAGIGGYKRWYASEAATYNITYYSTSGTFTSEGQITESIGSAGWRTFSVGKYEGYNGYTISGDDVEVYYVSSTGGDKAMLTPISSSAVIPTKAGIMLKGTGTFTVNSVATDGTALTGNMLVGSGSASADVPTSTGYILANEASGLGFYLVSDSEYSLAAHKAYLNVTSGARTFISFEEATGINNINVEEANAPIYNLQGIRLNQAQKGLNIINGKIVLKK